MIGKLFMEHTDSYQRSLDRILVTDAIVMVIVLLMKDGLLRRSLLNTMLIW